MMSNKEIIALPDHLVDHDYFLSVVYEVNHIVHEEVEELEGVEVLEEEKEQIVGVSETYTLIPGVHNRSRIYVNNLGFKYYKRQVRGHRVYYANGRRNGSSIALPLQLIHLGYYHDHQPGVIDLNLPFLRETISERGIDPAVST
ncbi:hypothetical protein QTP88_012467 [Uroleucon formosanum]